MVREGGDTPSFAPLEDVRKNSTACPRAPVLGRCLSPLSMPRVSWRALSAEQPGRLLPAPPKAAGRTGAQPPAIGLLPPRRSSLLP